MNKWTASATCVNQLSTTNMFDPEIHLYRHSEVNNSPQLVLIKNRNKQIKILL